MEREYKFLVENKELPKPMCIIKGYVQKSGRKLSFKYRNRYLELNPYKGILSRYKTYEDYKKTAKWMSGDIDIYTGKEFWQFRFWLPHIF